MLDSSAKSNPGALSRGIINTGKEDQCLQVNHAGVKGSFSLLKIPTPEGVLANKDRALEGAIVSHWYEDTNDLKSLTPYFEGIYSICHPHACSGVDLNILIDIYFNRKIDYKIVNVNRSLTPSASLVQKLSIFAIISLICYTIISTIKFNISTNAFKYIQNIGSRNFDVVSNTKLFIRKYGTEDKNIRPTDFINGWKTFYLVSALIVHMLSHIEVSVYNLNMNASKYLSYFEYFKLLFSRVSIETMVLNICSSAIVTCVTVVPFIESMKLKKRSLLLVTLLRYLRLLPVLSFSIMIILISPLISFYSSGIFHSQVTSNMAEKCSNYAWAELLLVNNFVAIDKICLGVSWFLSTDVQLSIITFPLLITLIKNVKKGIKLSFLYIILGIISEYIVIYIHYDAHSMVHMKFEKDSSYENMFPYHAWPMNFISSYSIGLVFGILIQKGIRIPEKYSNIPLKTFVYLIASISLIYTIDINYWNEGNKLITIGVASVLRTMAAIEMCIVMYSLWMEKDNWMKRILTSTYLFNTCARIMLPSFLCHALVLTWISSYAYSYIIEITLFGLISRWCIMLPTTILCGIVLHILVEVPFMKMLKSLIGKK